MPVDVKHLISDTRTMFGIILVVQVVTIIVILCHQLPVMSALDDTAARETKEVEKNAPPNQAANTRNELMVRNRSEHLEVSTESRSSLRQRDYQLTNDSTAPRSWTSGNVTNKNGETVRRYSDLLVPKSNWSSEDIKVPCAVPLQLPITKMYVKVTYITEHCFDYDQCKDLVLQQQQSIHNSQETDIQSNFLITDDGSIFEVLSWDCKVTFFVPDSRSIVVWLLGNYPLRGIHFTSLETFIHFNLITGNLSPSYQLMPYCCLTPGSYLSERVYARLTYFENFHGDECVGKDYCKHSYK